MINNKKTFLYLPLILVLCAYSLAAHSEKPSPALVIIIDDLGYNLELGERVLALPYQLTLSFLPHLPNTRRLATSAHQLGHEIMLHSPMSNIHNRKLGPGALTEEMDQSLFTDTVREAIASVPYVSGVNNHMGSQLTQQPEPMTWLMQELKRQNLYFIDSRTSTKTIAAKQADTHGIPHLSRHVFLDNERNETAIRQQMERLMNIADNEGIAVAIGHPYPETLQILEELLPTLPQKGFRLLKASEAIHSPSLQCEESTKALPEKLVFCQKNDLKMHQTTKVDKFFHHQTPQSL